MMVRTVLACACIVLLAYGAAAWVTKDFSAWTAEGARRIEVLRAPVAAPRVRVEGPGWGTRTLTDLLADGRDATIVDFIYTRCQSVCSALGTGFQQLQAGLRDGAARTGSRVRLLSVSFDGEHDDVAALTRYAARMRADAGLWQFARVMDERERRALMNAFGVVVIADRWGEYQHNAALLLIDRRGRLVRVLDYDALEEALVLADALAAKRQK